MEDSMNRAVKWQLYVVYEDGSMEPWVDGDGRHVTYDGSIAAEEARQAACGVLWGSEHEGVSIARRPVQPW